MLSSDAQEEAERRQREAERRQQEAEDAVARMQNEVQRYYSAWSMLQTFRVHYMPRKQTDVQPDVDLGPHRPPLRSFSGCSRTAVVCWSTPQADAEKMRLTHQLLSQIEDLQARLKAAEDARKAAEDARKTAEDARQTAEDALFSRTRLSC